MPNGTQFSLPLNRPEMLSYTLPLDHILASMDLTEPYGTDFIFYYKDLAIFGGVHTEVNVEDVDSDEMSVAGQGWLHYLERRFFDPLATDGYSVIDTDIFTIAEDLVGSVAGSLFSFNNGTCGQKVDYHIEPGDTETIYSKIDALSKIYPGFDYEITWDRQFKMYAPSRGSLKSYVFEQGSNCAAPTYRNPGIGGNFLWGTGSGSGGARASSYQIDSLSVARYRQHDVTKDFGEVSSPELLDAQAAGEAPRQSLPLKQISVVWVGDDSINHIFEEVWVGDTVRLIGDTDYEHINADFRIVNIEGNPTDEDDESLTFTFDDGTLSL